MNDGAGPGELAKDNEASYPVLDAGRGNPNWINTKARYAFTRLMDFATLECELDMSDGDMAGHAMQQGIGFRFDLLMDPEDETDAFLIDAVNYCTDTLGLDKNVLLKEFADGIIGDNTLWRKKLVYVGGLERIFVMKTLVIFFSLEGNTEYAAKKISEKTGASLLRLVPKKAYHDKGFAKFFFGGKSAVMAEKPELESYDIDPAEYDKIVFGFPVWASNFTPPLRTFIFENNEKLRGKHFSAFACQSGGGAEKAFTKLEKCLGGSLDHTLILIDPKAKPTDENNEKIEAFCREIGE